MDGKPSAPFGEHFAPTMRKIILYEDAESGKR